MLFAPARIEPTTAPISAIGLSAQVPPSSVRTFPAPSLMPAAVLWAELPTLSIFPFLLTAVGPVSLTPLTAFVASLPSFDDALCISAWAAASLALLSAVLVLSCFRWAAIRFTETVWAAAVDEDTFLSASLLMPPQTEATLSAPAEAFFDSDSPAPPGRSSGRWRRRRRRSPWPSPCR